MCQMYTHTQPSVTYSQTKFRTLTRKWLLVTEKTRDDCLENTLHDYFIIKMQNIFCFLKHFWKGAAERVTNKICVKIKPKQ